VRIRALTQTHRTEASDKGTRLSETGQEAVGERPPCLTSCLNPASALHHLKCPNYGLADLREAERDGSDETLKGRGRYVSDMLCVLSRCLCLGVLGLVLFALCRCAGCELRMRVCVSACVWGVDSPVHVVGHTLIIWACNAHASLTKDELHRSEQHSRTPAPRSLPTQVCTIPPSGRSHHGAHGTSMGARQHHFSPSLQVSDPPHRAYRCGRGRHRTLACECGGAGQQCNQV